MTDTLVSEHLEETLHELGWGPLSGTAEQWSVLFRLLPALDAQRWVLGTVRGTLRVARGAPDVPVFEEWPIDASSDVGALCTRVESLGGLSRPLELELSCEPLMWLADGHVNIIDYDDVDLFSYGNASIAKADGSVSLPGLHLWRLLQSRVLLLSLDVMFGLWDTDTSVGMAVNSQCDLWRPKRLDGEPHHPHGEANAALLAKAIGEIAAATGARIER